MFTLHFYYSLNPKMCFIEMSFSVNVKHTFQNYVLSIIINIQLSMIQYINYYQYTKFTENIKI